MTKTCTYMITSGMHRRPFEGRHLVNMNFWYLKIIHPKLKVWEPKTGHVLFWVVEIISMNWVLASHVYNWVKCLQAMRRHPELWFFVTTLMEMHQIFHRSTFGSNKHDFSCCHPQNMVPTKGSNWLSHFDSIFYRLYVNWVLITTS